MTGNDTSPVADHMRGILQDSSAVAPAMKEAMVYLATLLDWRGHTMARIEVRLNNLTDEHDDMMSGKKPCRQLELIERSLWRGVFGRFILPIIVALVCSTLATIVTLSIAKGGP